MPPADDPHIMSDTPPADALAAESGRRESQTNMEHPPKPDIDDWLGSLDRDLGSTPALASLVPAHPPAEAPSRDRVTHASDAVGAVAPPEAATEQPVAGTPGEIGAWLEQVDPRDGAVSVVAQKTDGLEKHLDGLLTRAAELQQKQTDLESAQDRLSQVDELTWARFDALQKSRADLETFQEEIHAFRTSRADITEVAGKLAADRTAFEGFVQRVADFQQRMPELDSEMDSISAKWSVAGKAVTVLGKKTDGLETRVDRLQQKQTDLESLQDRLNQVDELSNRTGAQFDALQKSRAVLETFHAEIQAFHTSRAEITEAAGKLAADRTAFEGFVQHVADFQQRLPGLDSEMDSISTKWSVAKKAVTVLGKKTDCLEDRFGQLLTQATALEQKQADLESLQHRVNQFEELSMTAEKLAADRTAFEGFVQRVADFQQRMPGLDAEMDSISAQWSVAGKAVTVLGKKTDGLETRVDTLQQKQTDLESLQDRLNQVDELSKTAEKLAAQQAIFERFVARVDDFQQRMPELESKMDAVTAKATAVAAQTQVVAAQTQQAVNLVAMADDLDLRVTHIEDHRQAVESIEARLNALKTLSDNVDRKLKEQVGRRTDVDETRREGLSSQIAAADGPLDRPVRKRNRRRRPRDCSVTAPD